MTWDSSVNDRVKETCDQAGSLAVERERKIKMLLAQESNRKPACEVNAGSRHDEHQGGFQAARRHQDHRAP